MDWKKPVATMMLLVPGVAQVSVPFNVALTRWCGESGIYTRQNSFGEAILRWEVASSKRVCLSLSRKSGERGCQIFQDPGNLTATGSGTGIIAGGFGER